MKKNTQNDRKQNKLMEKQKAMRNEHITRIQIDKTKKLMHLERLLSMNSFRPVITRQELEKNPERANRLLYAYMTGGFNRLAVKGMTLQDLKNDKV